MVSAINNPLSTTLVAAYKFGYVVLSFSFSSKYFPFDFFFFLIHVLFRSALYCFSNIGGFSKALSSLDF